jgi:hypothetical protein
MQRPIAPLASRLLTGHPNTTHIMSLASEGFFSAMRR